MSSAQHRLGDYLQYEQYHVLGAYRIAADGLRSLAERLESAPESRGDTDPAAGNIERNDLLRLTRIVRRYNERLGDARHAADRRDRHPIPEELPLSLAERFKVEPTDPDLEQQARDNPWVGPMTWAWVTKFYDAAIDALSRYPQDGHPAATNRELMADTLAHNLVWRRTSQRRLPADPEQEQDERDARRRRSEARRKQAYLTLPGQPRPASGDEPSTAGDEFLHRVVNDNLKTASSGSGSLPLFVVYAQAEAHMSMHAVEAWQSLALGKHAKLLTPDTKRWLKGELDRCIALSTFAFAASRSTPWIFAEDPAERRRVFEGFADAWKNVVPTRCMWIASQVSLLALHRRAYARSMKGDDTIGAYNDYHKLQSLIRDTERRVCSAPIHVEGALEFLTGLDAQAHHHIGELYRAQHAQRPALKHFRMASHRLGPLHESAKMGPVLTNSRWHVQLQVSQGKAHYEMGRHKESLCWHLQGWRAFLLLLAADTHTEASTDEIDAAVKWLRQVRFEPELRKSEVETYVRPVIAQLERIAVDRRLGALAADILLRLGHLLFVLNLGLEGDPPFAEEHEPVGLSDDERRRVQQAARKQREREATEQIKRTLAFPCLSKAAECDPHATLVGADLLKARLRVRSWFKHMDRPLPDEYADELQPMDLKPVAEQWPRSGDDYERLARVAEYLMLRAQLHEPPPIKPSGNASADAEEEENRSLAGDLLLNFFMHTDSINVRKSQVHRFLMRPNARMDPPEGDGRAQIEFVCMRRYSSAFPLLPRPSAFRALGGGYFVRLHRKRTRSRRRPPPFGIVIDPGVDFVENLYRTGYSMSDIHMVIVTHDHVDHLGSLDPLLSLMHEHGELSEKEGKATRPPKLVVYVNESVARRYLGAEQLRRSNDFRQLRGLLGRYQQPTGIASFPPGFELLALSTRDIDGRGHLDLSRKPSYGICIRTEDGASLAIAGDTPQPPDAHATEPETVAQRERWLRSWRPALEADVLVAHLSTVPLTELRKLAGLDASLQPPRKLDMNRIEARAQALDETAARYERQLEDAHARLSRRVDALQRAAELLAVQTRAAPQHETVLAATVRLDAAADTLERVGHRLLAELQRCDTAPTLQPQLEQLVLDARSLALKVRRLPRDAAELNGIRDRLEEAKPGLRGQIEFALWLRSHRGTTANLVGKVPDNWKTPPGHAYLGGTLAWARAYRRQRVPQDAGLFVIGELSEELGTVRGKIAGRLNETVFSTPAGRASDRFHALSSDIGLRVVVGSPDAAHPHVRARVMCTTCDLDMDREADERFHGAHEMYEVCVKGENEGIFYNCPEHDPRVQHEPTFLEQLERFDVFGR